MTYRNRLDKLTTSFAGMQICKIKILSLEDLGIKSDLADASSGFLDLFFQSSLSVVDGGLLGLLNAHQPKPFDLVRFVIQSLAGGF